MGGCYYCTVKLHIIAYFVLGLRVCFDRLFIVANFFLVLGARAGVSMADGATNITSWFNFSGCFSGCFSGSLTWEAKRRLLL